MLMRGLPMIPHDLEVALLDLSDRRKTRRITFNRIVIDTFAQRIEEYAWDFEVEGSEGHKVLLNLAKKLRGMRRNSD